ncbi:MAG: tetratricopeptide repeat protein [Noviherbaspirillum sp.]
MSFPPFPPRRLRALLLPLMLAALGTVPAHADDAADIARLAQAGKADEALKRIDAILSRQPADAQLRFMKGVMLSETRPAEAIAIFTRLTQDYPKLPEPHNNLAVLYAAAGQYEKARAALDKAMRTSPAYATAFENLGDVHARLASQAYDKALQIDPGAASGPATRLALVRSLGLPAGPTAMPAVGPIAQPKPAPAPPVALAAVAPAAPVEPPRVVKPTPPAPAEAPKAAKAAAPEPAEAPKAAKATPPEPAETLKVAKLTPPAPVEAPKAVKPPPAPEPKASAAPARTEVARSEPAKAAPAPVEPRQPVRLVKADKAENKPDSKADPKARAAQEAAAEKEAVLNAVESWAKAWSAQDVPAYLAHYAGDFTPAGGMNRKAWVEERQARITGKGRIRVGIDKPQVSTEGNTATVRFRQSYVSDRLSSTGRKTLVLERQRGKWLIKQERTGA